MQLNEDDDFGFSLVSEAELKTIEETLAQQVAQKQNELEQTSVELKLTREQLQTKMEGIIKMIMPLLNNLMADPTKEYIYWPERAKKISAFKTKLENYLNDN